MTNTIPLHLHIRQLAAMEHIRTCSFMNYSHEAMDTGKNKLRLGHRQVIRKYLLSVGVTVTEQLTDKMITRQNWENQFNIDKSFMDPLNTQAGKPKTHLGYETRPIDVSINATKNLEIYSDGSRNEDSQTAGTGLVVFYNNMRIFSRPYNIGDRTVFQSECYGLKRAALWLLDFENRHVVTGAMVNLYTDNQAVIMAMDNPFIDSKLVWETITLLNEVVKWTGANLTVNWVRGHSGHFGNELADGLAAEGTQLEHQMTDQPLEAESSIKGRLKRAHLDRWRTEWDTYRHVENHGRQSHNFFPTLRPKFAFGIVNSARATYSLLAQFMTGHNYMRRHQHLIITNQKNYVPDPRDTPICSFCGQGEETSEHIIGECGHFNQIRFKHFGSYQLQPPFTSLKKVSIVSFLRECNIDALSFFMETDHI